MPEEQTDAKDFDQLTDEFFDQQGENTPTDSSPENKQEEQAETTETSTAEVDKTEKVKEVEADESLTPEDKLNKVKEILGDDQDAIDAYIKEKGYHTDPAWQKQREIIDRLKKESEGKTSLDEETAKALEEFKQFRSTPEYIKMTMKSQGYTDEAINKKLQENGFEVDSKPEDDVDICLKAWGNTREEANEEDINTIKIVSKVSRPIIQHEIQKALGKELSPVKDHLSTIEQSENASKLVNTMKDTVKKEGILDYDKDIEPAINKFLDDNPDATQPDVIEHFKSVNHSLTVERLRTGKNKEERDEKRNSNRPNIPITKSNANAPKKTGNFDADADAFLESMGVQ